MMLNVKQRVPIQRQQGENNKKGKRANRDPHDRSVDTLLFLFTVHPYSSFYVVQVFFPTIRFHIPSVTFQWGDDVLQKGGEGWKRNPRSSVNCVIIMRVTSVIGRTGERQMEKVVLRGHHLLCVHGFQGMGYSPEFVRKMAEIVDKIRDPEQDFPIQVVRGFDDTCMVCPNKGAEKCEANGDSEEHVQGLDRNVITHLGLQANEIYWKSALVELTRERVEPADLDQLCAGCSWLSYGVCKEGIAKLKKGS
jgi:hypothetical protein